MKLRIPTSLVIRPTSIRCNPYRLQLIDSRQARPSISSGPIAFARRITLPDSKIPRSTRDSPNPEEKSYTRPASDLDQNVTKEEENHFEQELAKDKNKQIRTPWHRDGSDQPPVSRDRSAGAMTKGKLLTTPTRLFKLVLPLVVGDHNSDRKDIEPLALLVHPQQPLSYLERLIQSELPTITIDGREKIPAVHFRAEDSKHDEIPPGKRGSSSDVEDADEEQAEDAKLDAHDRRDATKHSTAASSSSDKHTSASHPHSSSNPSSLRGGPGEGGVESYSGLGHEAPEERPTQHFVRWSKSTEIGDFVRDAARGREFGVEIEGAPREIRVGVPSFGDRTYYLRMRLRKRAREIARMAEVKRECDLAAEAGAQRVAYAGFGTCVAWGLVVYYLTFMTDLGWDVMEPVTYLVGLAGLLGGYLWFLLNKREASYRSAMNLTVSRRQHKLYESRGFDVRKWEYLVEEGNALRREIMAVAAEYDVDWDERKDAQDEKVVSALKEHREATSDGKGEKGKKGKGDDD